MMRKHLILMCFCVFALAGCEKVIDPEGLPEQDPRVVVNCVAYNQQPLEVSLSSSKSIVSGKDYKRLDNGVCDLYEDGKFVETLKSAGGGNYVSVYEPRSGRTYKITASVPEYESVTGETRMPDTTGILSMERKDTVNYSLYLFEQQMFRSLSGGVRTMLVFNDDRSTPNFYVLNAFAAITDTSGNVLDVEASCSISHLNALSESARYFGNVMEFTDEGQQENKIRLDLAFSVYAGDLTNVQGKFKVAVYVQLGHVSEEYYKYAKTVREQAYNGGNPFSEPVQIYSNMSSGMGIFAGISSSPAREVFYGYPVKQ